ncbi:ABC transporter ATP-binding protein [Geomicrobium sp. JCM 19039]|uniref:ABC transporter ATP-binding protein n=1 Tax=Geomicrobium sp. JCM 19039 TaxID=1460636 RepID=UPI00045F0FEB|nr:ABC transporter ATP-binding protein [Geomicrobium sp. JCM 19039]GAK12099.1 ABC transporter, ATP-binding protein [Geomicrobium sp. JCM 19039]
MISIKGVSFVRERMILDQINWDVHQGEHWAILGMNGAGKTALLNIICGYQFPTKGKVHVLGQTFGESPWQDVRKRIGWVSFSFSEKMQHQQQNFGIEVVLSGMHASIGLHIDPSEKEMQKAEQLLQMLGVEHVERQPYEQMSQGEKQRVLIARALMAEPDILILDEPCNGLDFLAKTQLLTLIEKIADQEKTTILYVTHQIDEILPQFTHTLLLKEGKVFSKGKTEEQMTSETLSAFCETSVVVRENEGVYSLDIPKEVIR